jgi:hypothetical protein
MSVCNRSRRLDLRNSWMVAKPDLENLAPPTSNPVLTVGTSLPMAPVSLFLSLRRTNPHSPLWTGSCRQEIVVQGLE